VSVTIAEIETILGDTLSRGAWMQGFWGSSTAARRNW
jgi:hypothetical protein